MRLSGLRPLVVCLSMAAAFGCSRRSPPEATFSCESLQQRAMRCEQDALDLIKRRIHETSPDGSAAQADQQFAMLERRFRARLRKGGTRAQCEKFSAPSGAERLEKMKACYGKSGCVPFSECLLELDR